mmetsp:Transcript_53817/g.97054  ORF Transcript_53817/g.97054 Transcript_53817/m.97054 type:complete len:130 (+) Transcript_53817:10-399(+)
MSQRVEGLSWAARQVKIPIVSRMFRHIVLAIMCCPVLGGPLSGLLAGLAGSDANATCADSHHTGAHACVTSFAAFFPEPASQADHFLPDISSSSIASGHDSASAPLDQFDSQSLLAGRRPRIFVSFDKK